MELEPLRGGCAASALFRLLLACALLPAASLAQAWSTPDTNVVIADLPGEETGARMIATADGGFYVSWFDNTSGGNAARLQRLDAQGQEAWPHGGVLVSDRAYSSTTSYGLAVAADGDAVLSFQCCAAGAPDERVAVFRVGADGAQVWGTSGIAVTTPPEAVLVTAVAATSDGGVVVAWTNGQGALRAQKLDAGGAFRWGPAGITQSTPSGARFLADVQPGLGGDAIVAWSNQSGSTRILRAQKFASADGAALWGTDGTQVCAVGNLQAGYFPRFAADGNGGAAFAYYDAIGSAFNVRAQRLDAGGTRLLGDDGALATTRAGYSHTSPAFDFDAATGAIRIAWVARQVGSATLDEGLYAQRIDAAGSRSFGEVGLELRATIATVDGVESLSQLAVLPAPDGFIAAWVTGGAAVDNQRISTRRIGDDGALVWPANVALKTSPTRTRQLQAATSSEGFAAFVWGDAPTSDVAGMDVRVQHLPYNGDFTGTIFSHGFED